MKTSGIHHLTGITGDAQKNIDFYTGVLGLRMVKLTVNFDDPSAYHLYYGNSLGEPGTIATFFHWPQVKERRVGSGEITAIGFSIPLDACNYWESRLKDYKVPVDKRTIFGESHLIFRDPDGLQVELVADHSLPSTTPWEYSVPNLYAIRSFHHVTLCEDDPERTHTFLENTFGYTRVAKEGTLFKYSSQGDAPGRHLYLRIAPDLPRGVMGAGTVHHVAFRAKDDADEVSIRTEMLEAGMDATPVIDRQYFHSVYFREPGGVLFEIATDGPGFAIDESPSRLGSSLVLPAQYEPHRAQIEASLPKVQLPVY